MVRTVSPVFLSVILLCTASVWAEVGEHPKAAFSCVGYQGAGKQEFSLSELQCIEFPLDLDGLTLALWDSDIHKTCDFRGVVVSLDGEGQLEISSNYASSTQFTGGKVQILDSNDCPFIKLRVY